MIKTIEVEEGRMLEFKASAFSPIAYNMIFPNNDFIGDMRELKDVYEDIKQGENREEQKSFPLPVYQYFIRIAYLFRYQALAPTPAQTEEQREFLKKYPNPWEWLDTFETFSIYTILPEIMDMYLSNEVRKSTEKKGAPTPPGK